MERVKFMVEGEREIDWNYEESHDIKSQNLEGDLNIIAGCIWPCIM